MFSYSGPALLIYPDGSTAELDRVNVIEAVTDGVWQLSGAGTSAQALSGGEARIKLPTGGEADVIVSNVGTDAGGSSTSVTFLGS